jgi:hypothetical protein
VHASLDREAFEQNVHAETPEARTLRAFCRSRGLPLAHRPEADYGRKGTALAEALQLAASRERAPRSITLITDFHGVVNTDALRRTVQLLQAHGHALTVLMLTSRPETPLEAAVHGRTEARQLREARAFFGRLGVPLRVSDGPTPRPRWRMPRPLAGSPREHLAIRGSAGRLGAPPPERQAPLLAELPDLRGHRARHRPGHGALAR